SSLLAVHSYLNVVLLSCRNLSCYQYTCRAIIESKQYCTIIIELSSFHHNVQVGADFFHLQTCNIFCQVECMRSDVSHRACSAALALVCPPRGLLVVRSLQEFA